MLDLTLRYAATDDDVVAIHRFLCILAIPTLPVKANHSKSATEVYRVVNTECALMVMRGDFLVGTMGIIKPDFWYGDGHFLVNRWFHAIPGTGAGRMLIREAIAIARGADLELWIIDEAKCRLKCFNRNPLRDRINPFIMPALASQEMRPTLQ